MKLFMQIYKKITKFLSVLVRLIRVALRTVRRLDAHSDDRDDQDKKGMTENEEIISH